MSTSVFLCSVADVVHRMDVIADCVSGISLKITAIAGCLWGVHGMPGTLDIDRIWSVVRPVWTATTSLADGDSCDGLWKAAVN